MWEEWGHYIISPVQQTVIPYIIPENPISSANSDWDNQSFQNLKIITDKILIHATLSIHFGFCHIEVHKNFGSK